MSDNRLPSPYSSLFLVHLAEHEVGALRLVALPAQAHGPIIQLADIEALGQAVLPSGDLAIEFSWASYVGYTVLSESYALPEAGFELSHDGYLRRYQTSRMLRFMEESTWARDDFPGQLFHWEVVTEDHVVGVVGTEAPQVQRIPIEPHWLERNFGPVFLRR